jgi:hypothetical protein
MGTKSKEIKICGYTAVILENGRHQATALRKTHSTF